MTSVSGLSTSAAVIPATARSVDLAAGEGSAAARAAPAASGAAVTAQVSPAGTMLGDLFAAANQFVRDEHMEPCPGYVNGTLSDAAVLDVGKYNDYIFAKAADKMVGQAAAGGVTLDKDEVIKQLKESNSEIAAIKDDDASLKAVLGETCTFSELSPSDRRNLTDIYIAAKEKGLNTDMVQGIAMRTGTVLNHQWLGIQYAAGADWVIHINDAASPPEGLSESLSKIASDLYGQFGMSNMLINTIVAVSYFDKDQRSPMLSFLLALTGVPDPDRKGS